MKQLFTAVLALSLFATAAAAAEPAATPAAAKPRGPGAVFNVAPSGWYAELRAGTSTQDLGDADANIAYMEDLGIQNLGSPGDLHRFGPASAFALELGRTRGAWSFGVVTEHQRQRVRSYTAGTLTGALDMISLMSNIDVRAVATVRPANLFGFEVGASAGMSFAHYSEQFSLEVFPAPDQGFVLSGAYHAAAPAAGAHLGWRRPLYGNTWLTTRGAWVWRDFGEFKGTSKLAAGGETRLSETDLLLLDSGAKAQLDGSGFQFTAGLSHTFGGKR